MINIFEGVNTERNLQIVLVYTVEYYISNPWKITHPEEEKWEHKDTADKDDKKSKPCEHAIHKSQFSFSMCLKKSNIVFSINKK